MHNCYFVRNAIYIHIYIYIYKSGEIASIKKSTHYIKGSYFKRTAGTLRGTHDLSCPDISELNTQVQN